MSSATHTGLWWLSNGYTLQISSNPNDMWNNFACNFIFDAVVGGSGGGSPEVVASITGSTDLCPGNIDTLTAPAGYTSYYWNTGDTTQSISVDSSGTFQAFLIDSLGNHVLTQSITVLLLSPSPVNIGIIGNPILCTGSQVTLFPSNLFAEEMSFNDMSGSFLWSNGMTTPEITVLSGGTYSLAYTDGIGCFTSLDSIVITEVSPPAQPTIQVNGTSLACNTSNGVNYQWNFNGLPLQNDTLQVLNALITGYYTVTVIDITTGCSSTSVPVYIPLTTNEALITNKSLSIYPNPNSGKFNIELNSPFLIRKLSLTLFNSMGQEEKRFIFESNSGGLFKKTIDVGDLRQGVYQVQIRLENGITLNKRLIIQY